MVYSRHPESLLFFFNYTATTEIYTLSLHDALPIFNVSRLDYLRGLKEICDKKQWLFMSDEVQCGLDRKSTRLNSSHVSISYAVFCLKKKNAQVGSLVLVVSIIVRADILVVSIGGA